MLIELLIKCCCIVVWQTKMHQVCEKLFSIFFAKYLSQSSQFEQQKIVVFNFLLKSAYHDALIPHKLGSSCSLGSVPLKSNSFEVYTVVETLLLKRHC